MADKTDPTPPATDPNPEDAEKAYWERFTGTLDSWFDAKIKTLREEGVGTGRAGRNSLPAFMANLMFGPEKSK